MHFGGQSWAATALFMPICKLFWCAAPYLDKIVWHYLLSLLNQWGFTADAERSINCSKIGFGLTTFVLLFAQAVPRIYPMLNH